MGSTAAQGSSRRPSPEAFARREPVGQSEKSLRVCVRHANSEVRPLEGSYPHPAAPPRAAGQAAEGRQMCAGTQQHEHLACPHRLQPRGVGMQGRKIQLLHGA